MDTGVISTCQTVVLSVWQAVCWWFSYAPLVMGQLLRSSNPLVIAAMAYVTRRWTPSFRIGTTVSVPVQFGDDEPVELIRISPQATADVTEEGQLAIEFGLELSSALTPRTIRLQRNVTIPFTGSNAMYWRAGVLMFTLGYQYMRR